MCQALSRTWGQPVMLTARSWTAGGQRCHPFSGMGHSLQGMEGTWAEVSSDRFTAWTGLRKVLFRSRVELRV